MTFKFYVTDRIFYAMTVTKEGVKYYLSSTLKVGMDLPITEAHFMKALAYAIDTHDGYIMKVD